MFDVLGIDGAALVVSSFLAGIITRSMEETGFSLISLLMSVVLVGRRCEVLSERTEAGIAAYVAFQGIIPLVMRITGSAYTTGSLISEPLLST
jgi:hypothetical protein